MELSFESVLSVVPKTKSSAVNEEEAALVVFFADGYREIKAKELIKEILIHKPVSAFYAASVCRRILNSLPFVPIILRSSFFWRFPNLACSEIESEWKALASLEFRAR